MCKVSHSHFSICLAYAVFAVNLSVQVAVDPDHSPSCHELLSALHSAYQAKEGGKTGRSSEVVSWLSALALVLVMPPSSCQLVSSDDVSGHFNITRFIVSPHCTVLVAATPIGLFSVACIFPGRFQVFQVCIFLTFMD